MGHRNRPRAMLAMQLPTYRVPPRELLSLTHLLKGHRLLETVQNGVRAAMRPALLLSDGVVLERTSCIISTKEPAHLAKWRRDVHEREVPTVGSLVARPIVAATARAQVHPILSHVVRILRETRLGHPKPKLLRWLFHGGPLCPADRRGRSATAVRAKQDLCCRATRPRQQSRRGSCALPLLPPSSSRASGSPAVRRTALCRRSTSALPPGKSPRVGDLRSAGLHAPAVSSARCRPDVAPAGRHGSMT